MAIKVDSIPLGFRKMDGRWLAQSGAYLFRRQYLKYWSGQYGTTPAMPEDYLVYLDGDGYWYVLTNGDKHDKRRAEKQAALAAKRQSL